jgi:DNA mismatch endonuclease (patch repair protein)
MDKLTRQRRSEVMSRIRGRDTKPEIIVRRIVWAMGFRYRLCVRSLPGAPDLVLAKHRKAMFVHGCFWHRHSCPRGSMPTTRSDFWRQKLEGNKKRDARNLRALRRAGWDVLVIWECETRNSDSLSAKLRRFLASA